MGRSPPARRHSVQRDHACERSHFVVDPGAGDEPRPFRAVDLPVATTDIVTSCAGDDELLELQRRPGLVTYSDLVPTRGHRGERDAHEWWEQVRAGADDVRRDVTVQPPRERHETVWARQLTEAFPAVYRFSPLDADSSEVVDEIVDLASTRMSIS